MKLSVLVTALLFIGMIIFVFSQMTLETNEAYGTNINNSEFGSYDFSSDINKSIGPIQKSIDTIKDEEKGWFEKVGEGFSGIIAAVTFVPGLFGDILLYSGRLITGLGLLFGLPSYITWIILIMCAAWAVFEILKFFFQGRDA